MDNIKDAFQKVKQDISSLRNDLDYIKIEVEELNKCLFEIRNFLSSINNKLDEKIQNKSKIDLQTPSTDQNITPTNQHITQTDQQIIPTVTTHPSTDSSPFKPLKDENKLSSIGNGGVPTDRQTDPQTDRQTRQHIPKPENPIDNAAQILDSLDSLKKEIRLKFKRLTDRELTIFSTLYQLDEEVGYAEYKSIAQKLNLTESSIRDYIGRLIDKGISIEKKKINNKTIQLKISESLKKVASLPTILQLIDL